MLSIILGIVRITGITGRAIAVFLDSPEIFIVFGIIALLSPIPTLAFAHHLLYALLSKLSSKIHSSEIGKTPKLIPGLMSWWEGLYGWLVMMISILVSLGIGVIVLLLFDLRYARLTYNYRQDEFHIEAILSITFIIIAAFMYQFEYIFKQYITSTKTSINKSKQSRSGIDSLAQDAKLNKIRTELGLHQKKKNNRQL